MGDLFHLIVRSTNMQWGLTPRMATSMMADQLAGIALLPLNVFREYILELAVAEHGRLCDELQQDSGRGTESDAPYAFSARELRALMSLKSAESYLYPVDLRTVVNAADVVAYAQRSVGQFAQLLS